MTETLRSLLPSVYASLLPPHFDQPVVQETRATCGSCQMLNQGTLPDGVSGVFFRPETKCCTYQPSVPNYLIGALLSDTRADVAEGQERVRAHIKTRMGVTPQWLGPTAKYEVLYDASMRTSFGKNTVLKCTYYADDGRCTIWRHRETICSTFYCKFSSGALAAAFWKALKDYLVHMELTLARWAMEAVSLDVNEPNTPRGTLAIHELEDRPPPDGLYKKWWGPYVDREAEFYIACHDKIKTLNREKYVQLVDTKKGKELLTACMTAYQAIGTHKLPQRLQLNPKARVLPVVNGNGVIVTAPYNVYDSVLIDPELYQILRRFKHDMPAAEMRKKLREEEGIELEDALLESFSRHQILLGPDEKDVKR